MIYVCIPIINHIMSIVTQTKEKEKPFFTHTAILSRYVLSVSTLVVKSRFLPEIAL